MSFEESNYNLGPRPYQASQEGFPFVAGDPLRQFTEPMAAALIPAAALRAVAYDGIAPAVSVHSSVLERPWERLVNTALAGLKLSLGELEIALPQAEDLFKRHSKMKGVYRHSIGENKYINVPYDANDGPSQGWAHDSIFHIIEEGARRYSEAFTPEIRSAVYANYRAFAIFLGTPEKDVPYNTDDVDAYREKMITKELLKTRASVDLMQKIFGYHSLQAPLPLARFGQAITKMSIESPILDKAEIEVKPWERRVSNTFDATVRQTYGRVPRERREQAVPIIFNARDKARTFLARLAHNGDKTSEAA